EGPSDSFSLKSRTCIVVPRTRAGNQAERDVMEPSPFWKATPISVQQSFPEGSTVASISLMSLLVSVIGGLLSRDLDLVATSGCSLAGCRRYRPFRALTPSGASDFALRVGGPSFCPLAGAQLASLAQTRSTHRRSSGGSLRAKRPTAPATSQASSRKWQ